MLNRENQGVLGQSQPSGILSGGTAPATRGQAQQSGTPRDGTPETATKQLPSISVPKGGGAIRGMGEKFAANPVTGTGSMTVPIAASPGRSGFDPQLALSYDSGAGNGPFGFGWNLSLPSITRKTDKGLPQYRDAEESDVFILSGAEDLVPVLQGDGSRFEDNTTVPGYTIHRYRPRIEGLFARIERWTGATEGDVHWRSITKDNITTFYGKTAESRIFDPADSTRVFSWLICESYDDKGNAIFYNYKEENSDGVDLSQVHEKNRTITPSSRSANRHLKRIKYGNRTPHQFGEDLSLRTDWLFEVVFDYGEHYAENDEGQPTFVAIRDTERLWGNRQDPFSSYRAGFEVRTYRLCRRVLMFHHFSELGDIPCLVRATGFTYNQSPIASFITQVIQSGYVRLPDLSYLKKSLPPLEFEYSQAIINEEIQEVDAESLENLPYGLDGARYQWVDLDGEGLSGILTEQGDGWFYKRNLSPINIRRENGREMAIASFGPVELVAEKPSLAALNGGGQQFLDLAGDGQLDLVDLQGPTPGFYERTHDESWESFAPFDSLPVLDWSNPNLKFVDLTGDGHADIFISEDEAFCWHPSLAEAGFGPAEKVRQALDEEKGPRLVFADGTQSIYLADISGDGLTDLVRIRNGEVCYWPNLGYGRFGPKVTMDNAPWFDAPDLFDQRRIRLADIDGSGVTDIIYLGSDGVHLYFNQSGNSWRDVQTLTRFPRIDNLSAVMAVDLLGNGTACLVWSSSLPGDARRPMHYVVLMGGQKPHLLIRTINNLGAETEVNYAPSTKFYLRDKRAGNPWITKLPFPVHVVERVITKDRISRNRFVTRYAYHHGYFDGIEREFRGFGMVEQFDTEAFDVLNADGSSSDATNLDEASHVPPVLTKTWFHTGIYLGRDHVSNFFAGLLDRHDRGEYYREPAWRDDDVEAQKRLLDDTVLPAGLTVEEEREACRALKGAMLRQEVYAIDGTGTEDNPHGHLYTVTEQNFTIKHLQPQGGNRHAVFFAHPLEALSYHYERNPADPRIAHAMTLEVDDFGNVLRSITVGYPRANVPARQPEQNETHLTLTLNRFANRNNQADWYRVGLPVESRTYEVVKPPTAAQHFTWDEMSDLVRALVPPNQAEPPATMTIAYEQWDWRKQWNPQTEPGGLVDGVPVNTRLRLIEHVRTLYRKNDLTDLLPLGTVESLALPGESYKVAFTPGLAQQIYIDSRKLTAVELGNVLANEGRYVHSEGDSNWWIPSGRIFYSPDETDTPSQELAFAQDHFFLPHRVLDPFGETAVVHYDDYKLLATQAIDPLDNTIIAENDYRVLQPWLVTDPNGNRAHVVFDTLGMVAATAVMGKASEDKGDLLDENFPTDLTEAELFGFIAAPHSQAAILLRNAGSRVIYDLHRFQRSGQPPFAATLARETHFRDGGDLKIQISFTYSDGFGREAQTKVQAEAGDAPEREPDIILPDGDRKPGALVLEGGEPQPAPTDRRWVGNGRTIYNNKGKPVKKYEPFFSATHLFEEEPEMAMTGVTPILFYDPVERVIATLHPNHTWEKVIFDPWRQESWDVNDTVLVADPKADADVGDFFSRLPDAEYLPTWHALRTDPAHATAFAALYPDANVRANETQAARKTEIHAGTSSVAHADSLGRTFLTVAHNKFKYSNTLPADPPTEEFYETRVILDIEGNQRAVRDAKQPYARNGDPRVVMRYDYDMLGNRIHQASMEAGERWMLNDVAGKPIRAWDTPPRPDHPGHTFRMEYDALRRPVRSFVQGAVTNRPNEEILFERVVYGEQHPRAADLNLRTRAFLQLDGAGLVRSEEYDFKGNLLRGSRRLAIDYGNAPDWKSLEPLFLPAQLDLDDIEVALEDLLEAETFESSTRYDVLNRPTQLVAPHSNAPDTRFNVIRPGYNEANLLERMDVWLNRETEPDELLARDTADERVGVRNVDYNARGQRVKIQYANDVTTDYEYDDKTFRMTNLKTTRLPGRNGLASQLFSDLTVVQNLHYTYDPAGNITRIEDAALQTIVHDGENVQPVCDYTYDAIYRLIEAHGREHIGQMALDFDPADGNRRDYPFSGLRDHPNDLQAIRKYTERYEYDEVGNFTFLRHIANGGSWTRHYDYDADSQIEADKKSNRLTGTTVGNGFNRIESYTYDAHGNMTSMPHLPDMIWNFKDQLQQVDLNGGGRAYYVYDAAGQRVRKVHEHNGSLVEERIYLGGFEIYRKNGVNPLVRETLHIMDDKQRIALVDTRTEGEEDDVPAQLIRYQFGNHLGSACLELDDNGAVISYEEYHPYGTTSYQAGRTVAEVSLKRYRYTGMERDEETGLNYHTARYYALWLGRWCNADPKGIIDGPNIYSYVRNSPIRFNDPSGTDVRRAYRFLDWHREHYNALETVARAFGNLAPEDIFHVTRGFTIGGETISSQFIPTINFGFETNVGLGTGLRQELDDSQEQQLSHFLTAASLGYDPALIGRPLLEVGEDRLPSVGELFEPGATDYRRMAIQLVVGHELVGDPRGMDVFFSTAPDITGCSNFGICLDIWPNIRAGIQAILPQYRAGAHGIDQFERALEYLSEEVGPEGTVDFQRLDQLLRQIGDIPSADEPRAQSEGTRRGNSIEDFRLTALGFYFGEALRRGELQGQSAYRWLIRNLGGPQAVRDPIPLSQVEPEEYRLRRGMDPDFTINQTS